MLTVKGNQKHLKVRIIHLRWRKIFHLEGFLEETESEVFSGKTCLPYDGSVIPPDCEENEYPVYYEHSTSKIL